MGGIMKVLTSARAVLPAIGLALVGLLLVVGCTGGPDNAGGAGHGADGVSGGKVGKVRATNVTGDAGWCTYYAELAWFTYTDPGHVVNPADVHGNGQDVAGSAASAYGGSVESTPKAGAIVSFSAAYMGEADWGHVAYVVAADSQSYTVWEMNWGGLWKVNRRVIAFNGPTPGVTFFWPPHNAVIDPEALAAAQFGQNSWWCTAQDCVV
jgi:surface antigen